MTKINHLNPIELKAFAKKTWKDSPLRNDNTDAYKYFVYGVLIGYERAVSEQADKAFNVVYNDIYETII